MKELVSKTMLRMVVIVTILLIVIYAIVKYYDVISTEISSLEVYVSQTKENALLYEEFHENAKQLFIDDYVNRVKNINAILKLNEDKELTAKELEEISYFENISNIYIINNEGVIIQSSDSDMVGIDFYKQPELEKFIQLIESSGYGYYCEFEGKSFTTGKPMIYLMVRNQAHQLIQIEIIPEMLHSYLESTSIANYIKGLPLELDRTILAMDSNTGELITITENKEQTIQGVHLLKTFKKAENIPKIIQINGHWQLTLTKQVSDNLMVVGFTDIASLFQKASLDIIVFALFIFLLNLCVYYFVVRDLRRLKEGINNSNDQLEFAVSILGKGFTGYEYFAEYNRLFIVDDILELTGWTRGKMEEEVKQFFDLNRPDKGEKKSIRTIVQLENGKILRVNRYITYNTMYAIVQDITEKERLKKKLLLANKDAYKDELTKLYNRRKLEYVIHELNKTQLNLNGVMLLMDLDNFKKVNDELGHVEGDALLRKFADLMRENFRDSDLKVRLGGDEFVVFMPNFISEMELVQKIEQFLHSVRKELAQYYEKFHLSVSVGAVYMNAECKDFKDLYHCADTAMYVAKRYGKDGYYIYNEHKDCTK